jgi:transposase-like protein
MIKKKWSPEEKIAIVLEMIKGEKAVTQICKSYGVSDGIVYKWRDAALEAMHCAMSDKRKQRNVANEAEKERLLKIIGQQTVVIDYQKKNSQGVLA